MTLERAARLLAALAEHEVLPHVAVSLISKALDESREQSRELLDWCEIAIEVCRQKRASGQKLRNPAGLLIKIARDPESRARLVPKDLEAAYRHRFSVHEQSVLGQEREAEQRRKHPRIRSFSPSIGKALLRRTSPKNASVSSARKRLKSSSSRNASNACLRPLANRKLTR